MLDNISVIIRTLGRTTLPRSIDSAVDEGFTDIMVISDGEDISKFENDPKYKDNPNVRFLQLNKRYGYAGGECLNVGARISKKPYMAPLDDDDVFMPGAKKFMNKYVDVHPDIDIFIPAFNVHGTIMCFNPGLHYGNVCLPTMKTDIYINVPFKKQEVKYNEEDYLHIQAAVDYGYKIDWYRKVLYNVRPGLPGNNGDGQKF